MSTDPRAPLTLTIEPGDIAAVRGLLLKLKAAELSELRRVQTQLGVYGDRRASMEGEPGCHRRADRAPHRLLRQIETG